MTIPMMSIVSFSPECHLEVRVVHHGDGVITSQLQDVLAESSGHSASHVTPCGQEGEKDEREREREMREKKRREEEEKE